MDKFSIPSMLSKIWQVLCDISTKAAASNQADWNEADDTSSSYIKNKPTIPAAQIQSDWNQADNTKPDFIKNKPDVDMLHLKVTLAFKENTDPESQEEYPYMLDSDNTTIIERDGRTPKTGDRIEVLFEVTGMPEAGAGIVEINGLDPTDWDFSLGPYYLTMLPAGQYESGWINGQIPGAYYGTGLSVFALNVKCPIDYDGASMITQTLGYDLSGIGWELGWI